jgi:hypothetical protein
VQVPQLPPQKSVPQLPLHAGAPGSQPTTQVPFFPHPLPLGQVPQMPLHPSKPQVLPLQFGTQPWHAPAEHPLAQWVSVDEYEQDPALQVPGEA